MVRTASLFSQLHAQIPGKLPARPALIFPCATKAAVDPRMRVPRVELAIRRSRYAGSGFGQDCLESAEAQRTVVDYVNEIWLHVRHPASAPQPRWGWQLEGMAHTQGWFAAITRDA